MKQTVKVVSISIDQNDLQDIRKAYKQMIADTDLHNMAAALSLLNPEASSEITIEEIKEELEKCYKDIIEAWGPVNDDGSIDIDLLDYPSASSDSSLGFILKLYFNPDKMSWIWTLNAEIASNYIYPVEDPYDED